jgi:signal transduction histidine kinase
VQKHLNAIQRSAELLEHLVTQLLAFSRSGRTELRREPIDANGLVAEVLVEVLASLEPETRGRDLLWEITALPVLQADLGLMRSVWTNLLANALKFTLPRAQAIIQVGVVANAEGVTFSVRDNGVGPPPDQAHRLFGVFQRLHATKDFPGTGLGLANVHRIIQRHGGRIWAESEEGHGATFTFFLPLTPWVPPSHKSLSR